MKKEDRDRIVEEIKRRVSERYNRDTARTPMHAPMIAVMIIIIALEATIYLISKS